MTPEQANPGRLAADAVLMAGETYRAGLGAEAAVAAITGVYAPAVDVMVNEVSSAAAQLVLRLAADVSPDSRALVLDAARQVGELTVQHMVEGMGRLLFAAAGFGSAALDELADLRDDDHGEVTLELLRRLRDDRDD